MGCWLDVIKRGFGESGERFGRTTWREKQIHVVANKIKLNN